MSDLLQQAMDARKARQSKPGRRGTPVHDPKVGVAWALGEIDNRDVAEAIGNARAGSVYNWLALSMREAIIEKRKAFRLS